MSDLQKIVLDSLVPAARHDLPLSQQSEAPSLRATLAGVEEARRDLGVKNIFRTARLYGQREELPNQSPHSALDDALRLLLLWHDLEEGAISEADLDSFLFYLETRLQLEALALDIPDAILYLGSFYSQDELVDFLRSLCCVSSATVLRWLDGANPGKSARQKITSAAEIFYQLHDIKGLDHKQTRTWFKKHAYLLIRNSPPGPWNVYSDSLSNRLMQMGLVPLGVNFFARS